MTAQVVTVRANDSERELAPDERRTAPRFATNLEITCSPVSCREAAPWIAQVINISRGGVALALGRRFESGTVLSMTLENPDHTVSRTLLARVVHVSTKGQESWVHGCRFSNEIYDEDLDAFRAQRVQPSGQDERNWVRFTCDVPTSCRPASGGSAMPVRIVNIAPGGVGLLGPATIDVGAMLTLKLPSASGQFGRKVLVRVVQTVSMSPNVGLLGCEFAQELTEYELRSLSR